MFKTPLRKTKIIFTINIDEYNVLIQVFFLNA